MGREVFDMITSVDVAWSVKNPEKYIQKVILSGSRESWAKYLQMTFSDNVDRKVFCCSEDDRRKVLETILKARGEEPVEGHFTATYFERAVYVEIASISFGSGHPEPVQVFVNLKDTTHHDVLISVVCDYDYCNQTVNLRGNASDDTASLKMTPALERFVCRVVKDDMDIIFSDTRNSEKRLLKILCEANHIRLEKSPFHSVNMCVCYREGGYGIDIPLVPSSLKKNQVDFLPFRKTGDKLENGWLSSMYCLLDDSPSFLNQEFMYLREKGKRNGTKVVQNLQEKLTAILKQAEDYTRAINACRNAA